MVTIHRYYVHCLPQTNDLWPVCYPDTTLLFLCAFMCPMRLCHVTAPCSWLQIQKNSIPNHVLFEVQTPLAADCRFRTTQLPTMYCLKYRHTLQLTADSAKLNSQPCLVWSTGTHCSWLQIQKNSIPNHVLFEVQAPLAADCRLSTTQFPTMSCLKYRHPLQLTADSAQLNSQTNLQL